MQKIIDNIGITISAACAIHCVLLPAILIIAPYSFFASHEFHETLIYFILPFAAIAFYLGCRKHGDYKVLSQKILLDLELTNFFLTGILFSETILASRP